MSAPFIFDFGYRERVRLHDGMTATLRLVRPGDKEQLRRGFDQLSDDARYNRFFVRKAALLDSEVRYLTEVDQIDHVALVAFGGRAGKEGIAVARAIRLAEEPQVYEAAVTVLDAFQRQGIGSLLVRRLMTAAAERGARRLQFWVLPTNVSMRRLLQRVTPQALIRDEDELLRVDVPLLDRSQRRGLHVDQVSS
jgi:GNAT superfamily N-acetyltransferase